MIVYVSFFLSLMLIYFKLIGGLLWTCEAERAIIDRLIVRFNVITIVLTKGRQVNKKPMGREAEAD